MRLVDADALMEVFRGEEGAKALDHFPLRLIKVKQIVDNSPTIGAIPVEWLRRQYHKYMQNNDKLMCDAYAVVMGEWYDWQKEQEAK